MQTRSPHPPVCLHSPPSVLCLLLFSALFSSIFIIFCPSPSPVHRLRRCKCNGYVAHLPNWGAGWGCLSLHTPLSPLHTACVAIDSRITGREHCTLWDSFGPPSSPSPDPEHRKERRCFRGERRYFRTRKPAFPCGLTFHRSQREHRRPVGWTRGLYSVRLLKGEAESVRAPPAAEVSDDHGPCSNCGLSSSTVAGITSGCGRISRWMSRRSRLRRPRLPDLNRQT